MSVPCVSTYDSDKESADLALFEEARNALRGFNVTKEELLWRITHRLKTADKTRKAIEKLFVTASLGQHQSRADDCACEYAAARPDHVFPGYDSPIDVFYGCCMQVPSRVDQWRAAWPPRWETAQPPGLHAEPTADVQSQDTFIVA